MGMAMPYGIVLCQTALCLVLLAALQARAVHNTVGRIMPKDAAALDEQVFRYLVVGPATPDANIANYKAQNFEGSTLINSDQELLPAAADRWEVSGDQLKWTFYLREGARWSDGCPVTVHDVKYTYKAVSFLKTEMFMPL